MDPLPRNPGLERALLADPAQLEGYLVWSDWLMSEGEPHGELVALECALAASPGDEACRRRRDEVVSLHGRELRVPHRALEVERQSLGLFHTAVIRGCLPRDLAAACASLAASRMARLLQVLRIEITFDHGSNAPVDGHLHYDELLEL